MKKTIFTGYAPNLTTDDLRLAIKFIFLPWYWGKWEIGSSAEKVERILQDYFCVDNAVTVDSGRTALLISLEALGIKNGDHVIVQAFTCLVVVNAITKLGAKPIFVDIDRSANMDPKDLKKKITNNTKAIIVQHTFGMPAQINEIITIAKSLSLPIIEDCAHSIGATFEGKKLGTFGDLAILSFGSDKIISCARGGAILINNPQYKQKIIDKKNNLPETDNLKILQHLMHYPVFYIGKKTYHILLGKIILWTARKIHLTNSIIYPEEKRGEPMKSYPSKLPEALAQILLLQLKNLNTVITQRKSVAKSYSEKITSPWIVHPAKDLDEKIKSGSVYLRYPILTKNPQKLYHHAKTKGIMLGNWYDTVVSPYYGVTAKIDYIVGSCPNAEYYSKHIVNLPTDIIIGKKEEQRIIDALNTYKEE